MSNKNYISILFSLMALIGNFSLFAEEHQHHHQQQTAELALNHGEKWSIDESLHIGMTNIKNDISANLALIHQQKFTAKQYQGLALGLEKHLSFLFENCQLAPQADAQLHILLADIMQGVAQMKHSDNGKPGAVLIIQALKNYPQYFADPRWQNLAH
ncbi:hypothetical protein tinsulaeT_29180 [Thalassotalea insulae]|uniref:DnrO protein n=1 Tax=Thalassotalea insulae TaxID=2056778 RepID=A0ABQ6GUG3_9GAMM|nr:hypothetical protein [Thalassotalea insulae]GLX79578.1 hypothetical protein tinsulaeT_29180 [Thalassotalea insulae]